MVDDDPTMDRLVMTKQNESIGGALDSSTLGETKEELGHCYLF